MTRHVGEDTLIKLSLGLLDPQADRRVHRHLAGCPGCRGLLEEVDRTLRQIREVTPEVTAEIPVLPSLRHNRFTWLRVAAMLAVGFGLGFLASESLRSPSINVVRQQIVPQLPEFPAVGFVACDEVDLSRRLR